MKLSKRFVITLITLFIILVIAAMAVFLAKGYTFSTKEGRVLGTGIISVTSIPDGASVYLDGHLTTATNTTVSQLSPKTYTVKITKEGHIPWEKTIEVKEGLVSEIKATLFPAIPTIYPLTFNGAVNPVLSPDGQSLAFAVPVTDESHTKQRGGVWVWTMSSQPISFNRGAQPHQIVTSDNVLDFSKAKIAWSPDSKNLLITLQEGGKAGVEFERNYLLEADQLTVLRDLKDITPTIDSTLKTWVEDNDAKEQARLIRISDSIVRNTASASATLHWSPDETKILMVEKRQILQELKKGSVTTASPTPVPQKKAKIYDIETGKEYFLPDAKEHIWLPDSLHIILVNEDTISVCEFDGANVSVIYAGKFENGYVFPWPDSSRLAIVGSFSTPTASKPNLLGINLK